MLLYVSSPRRHAAPSRPIARPRTGSIWRSATSIATRICSTTRRISQRDFESAQADYNDAATDRADVAAGAQDLRRHRAGPRRGRAPERRHPARAGDARAASPARSCRRWCCPASSSRPAPPRRSSSATSRPSGCRDTSTRRTCVDRTWATPSRCATRRSRDVFHGTVVVHRRHDRSGHAHHTGADRDRRTATGC